MEEHEIRKENHTCTDCPCCVLFLVCIVGWIGTYIYGANNGNMAKMFHGIQSVEESPGVYVNSICGVDDGVQGKPYLYWCMKGSLSSLASMSTAEVFAPVCVSACPGANPGLLGSPLPPECTEYHPGIANVGYATISFLGRYCLPQEGSGVNITDIADGQLSSRATEVMESMSSVSNSWKVLIGTFFIALVLGYIYLVLLKCCAEPLIWFTMIASIVGFAVLSVYLWTHSDYLQQSAETGTDIPSNVSDHISNTSKAVAVVSGILSIALFFLMCCFCSSIKTAAAVVQVACETIWEMPILLIAPLFKALVKGAIFAVILVGFLLVWTTADPAVVAGDGLSRHFEHTNEQKAFIAYYVFVSLWLLAFTDAFYQFLVAVIVGDYYYAPFTDGYEKDVGQCHAACTGIFLGLVTHSGSLAFGSLIIAIIQFVQKLLEYAEKKNKESGDNKVISCILYALICCCQCCKEFIEYINKNAYIDIAITGNDNFCQACKNVMTILVQQGGAMAILAGATYVFTVFGTVFIALGSSAIAYLIINQGEYNAGLGSDSGVPDKTAVMIVAAAIALTVALSFMGVFDMTADTLLYCFGYDRSQKRFPSTAPGPLQALCDEADRGEHDN